MATTKKLKTPRASVYIKQSEGSLFSPDFHFNSYSKLQAEYSIAG